MTNGQQSGFKEYIDTVRTMIEHENILRNNRLTWMWALQGLLMTATGVLWEKTALAVLLVGITGVVSCLSIWKSLHICNQAIDVLQKKLRAAVPSHILKQHPPEIGLKAVHDWYLPWNLLPIFFVSTWISLIAVRYCDP